MFAAPPVIKSEVSAHAPEHGLDMVVQPVGALPVEIQSCAGTDTTNAAFGGRDGKIIYVTESETGTILWARLVVAGKAMYTRVAPMRA